MIKNENNQMIVRFENGDINIVSGILIEEEVGVVAFRTQTPREIGVHNGDKPSEQIESYPIVFNFTNTKSIDVLIYALQKAKEMMKNRNQILKEVGVSDEGN